MGESGTTARYVVQSDANAVQNGCQSNGLPWGSRALGPLALGAALGTQAYAAAAAANVAWMRE
jgi:hypothetical protein